MLAKSSHTDFRSNRSYFTSMQEHAVRVKAEFKNKTNSVRLFKT